MFPPADGRPTIRFFQSTDAQPHKLAGAVGGVDYVREMLHMGRT